MPATDDELDNFIQYMETLEEEDSPMINKPFKQEDLSYAGQDFLHAQLHLDF